MDFEGFGSCMFRFGVANRDCSERLYEYLLHLGELRRNAEDEDLRRGGPGGGPRAPRIAVEFLEFYRLVHAISRGKRHVRHGAHDAFGITMILGSPRGGGGGASLGSPRGGGRQASG